MKIVDTHIVLYEGQLRKVHETSGQAYFMVRGGRLDSMTPKLFQECKDDLEFDVKNLSDEDYYDLTN